MKFFCWDGGVGLYALKGPGQTQNKPQGLAEGQLRSKPNNMHFLILQSCKRHFGISIKGGSGAEPERRSSRNIKQNPNRLNRFLHKPKPEPEPSFLKLYRNTEATLPQRNRQNRNRNRLNRSTPRRNRTAPGPPCPFEPPFLVNFKNEEKIKYKNNFQTCLRL